MINTMILADYVVCGVAIAVAIGCVAAIYIIDARDRRAAAWRDRVRDLRLHLR